MNITMKHAVLAVALTGVFSTANATNLINDAVTANVDLSASYFGGTLLNSATSLINNISYNGTARTAVYRTAEGMDFYYQFTNNASAKNGVERFTGWDFSGINDKIVSVFQTSAAFGIFQTGSITSDNADRSSSGVIGFNFTPAGTSPTINPGKTSYTQIVRTTANAYVVGNFGLLDGIGDNAKGFAPVIPEPSTYALLLAGLGMLGFVGRRRLAKGASEIFSGSVSGLGFA